MPEPTILAIDHELIYRDLNESWFNSFTVEDYSELSRNAKEKLREKAVESELLDAAREQQHGQRRWSPIKYFVWRKHIHISFGRCPVQRFGRPYH